MTQADIVELKPGEKITPHVKEWSADTGTIYQEGVWDITVTVDRSALLETEIEIDGIMYKVVGTPAMETFMIRKIDL